MIPYNPQDPRHTRIVAVAAEEAWLNSAEITRPVHEALLNEGIIPDEAAYRDGLAVAGTFADGDDDGPDITPGELCGGSTA